MTRATLNDRTIDLGERCVVWNAGGILVQCLDPWEMQRYQLFEVLSEEGDESFCRPLVRGGEPVVFEEFHEACREAFAEVVERTGITEPKLRVLARMVGPGKPVPVQVVDAKEGGGI